MFGQLKFSTISSNSTSVLITNIDFSYPYWRQIIILLIYNLHKKSIICKLVEPGIHFVISQWFIEI
jgi:hypothetical protein